MYISSLPAFCFIVLYVFSELYSFNFIKYDCHPSSFKCVSRTVNKFLLSIWHVVRGGGAPGLNYCKWREMRTLVSFCFLIRGLETQRNNIGDHTLTHIHKQIQLRLRAPALAIVSTSALEGAVSLSLSLRRSSLALGMGSYTAPPVYLTLLHMYAASTDTHPLKHCKVGPDFPDKGQVWQTRSYCWCETTTQFCVQRGCRWERWLNSA